MPAPAPKPVPTPQPMQLAAPASAPVKQLAPEGVYYVLQRISIETESGLVAIPTGAKVNLLRVGPPMRVTDGKREFEIDPSLLTNDLEIAGQTYHFDSQQQAESNAANRAQVQIGRAQELEFGRQAKLAQEAAARKLRVDTKDREQEFLSQERARLTKEQVDQYHRTQVHRLGGYDRIIIRDKK